MAAGAPEVTVVAATHNRSGLLRRLLEGLRAQTISPDRFEVVIVDDGSSDDTPEVLSAAEAAGDLRLRVLRNDPAGGPAVARNRGWRAARAPLVAFTDDDCRPSEAWLERLLAAASGDRVVQGRTQPDPLDADSLGPFAKTVVIEEPSLHYETCNILYPRAVLDRLDGFDEAYPAPAGEDTDLGQRSAADGVDRVFSPDALVYHAVHDQSRKQALKGILIAAAGVQTYKANPSLRAHLTYRVFYRRSHPLWLQAVLAVYLIRKSPLAGLFTLPYLAHLLNRVRTTGGSPADVPFMVLLDAVEIGATAVGAVRHRTPLI